MDKKSKVDIVNSIKKSSGDLESLKGNSANNSFMVSAGGEAVKYFLPIVGNYISRKINLDLEIQKNVVDEKLLILKKRSEQLIEFIAKEEMKEDYNQERIDSWKLELKDISNEYTIMEEKSDGFVKGFLNGIKDSINKKKIY